MTPKEELDAIEKIRKDWEHIKPRMSVPGKGLFCVRHFDTLLAKIVADATTIAEWQDAKNNPPKKPYRVILYFNKTDVIRGGYYGEDGNWYLRGGTILEVVPTLWMHIPPINLTHG